MQCMLLGMNGKTSGKSNEDGMETGLVVLKQGLPVVSREWRNGKEHGN